MRLCFFFIGALLSGVVFAQPTDTTYLQEVSVYGIPFTTYATGSTIETLRADSTVETLADRLNNTTLYLKTYGNGQLTTISMRGTTASQTAVLWNGININSPTLGQTDFSLLPLFLIDEVSVRYGSSSALYGSDAIGGSILLGQAPAQFTKYVHVSALQQAGSFGEWATGIKVNYGNGKFEFRSKFSSHLLENNFKYHSPANGYEKTQNHAAVTNYGLDQQIFYKISSTQQISLEGMWTHNFREVQPAVTNNDADETLQDEHLRFCLNYLHDAPTGIISATVALINGTQRYTDSGMENRVESSQISAQFNVDKSIDRRSNIRYGANYNHFTATSKNYTAGLNENRYDLYASYRFALTPAMIISLDLRQAFYNRSHAPFTPSLGFEWIAEEGTHHKVTWRAQAGRGFRIPTLNDRFWQPGGNPNISAEQSFSIESGARWNYANNKVNGLLDVTVFKNWMTDMIVWLPSAATGDVWTPNNLQQVHVHGIEGRSVWQKQIQRTNIQFDIAYSYIRSINQKGLSVDDESTVNKQLAYVPVHSARTTLGFQRSGWAVNAHLAFTGQRFVALDNGLALDPYSLMSFDVSKKLQWMKWSMLVKGECGNILDIYYENLRHHAMPGRNYSISVFINFKNHIL